MEIELTRAAKKSLAALYKEYRQRINAGMKKAQAISFENCSEDILESRNELKAAVRREAPIPYPHFLAPIIDDLILHAGKKGKMVPVQKDNYYTRYYAKLAELGIRKLPPYSCRHTTGTALAKGNIAPATIQKAMRHAKLETQKRYTHMDTSDVRAALDITKPDQVAKQG